MTLRASGGDEAAPFLPVPVVSVPVVKIRHRAGAASTAPRTATRTWQSRMSRRLWVTDLTILVLVVFGTQIAWFGFANATVVTRTQLSIDDISYWGFSAALVVLWMWVLSLTDTRAATVIGTGNQEYLRVMTASFRLFGALAIIAFLIRFDIARGYLLIALPVGVVLLEASRWVWRQWLVRQRARGAYSERVILVGTASAVREMAAELRARPDAGYTVVGACLTGTSTTEAGGVPALGTLDDLKGALTSAAADTVIVASTEGLPPTKVKEISWMLESGRQHLVLTPGILDIAGPRIHTRPVSGLPLIHVETPHLSRGQQWAKRLLDAIVSAVLLVLLSPLLLVIAALVRMTGGPALFMQTRIGRDGRPFRMFKFRSMVVGAEDRLGEVIDWNTGNEVLFKHHEDPRVTPLGRWMRRHSVDELPQLLNVLCGTMSLVGPRPPLPQEVEKYSDHVHRRFLTRPGMTGAWQVGGRSTLSWEESVRLDLSYVENWSLTGDVVILAHTFREVVAPGRNAA